MERFSTTSVPIKRLTSLYHSNGLTSKGVGSLELVYTITDLVVDTLDTISEALVVEDHNIESGSAVRGHIEVRLGKYRCPILRLGRRNSNTSCHKLRHWQHLGSGG